MSDAYLALQLIATHPKVDRQRVAVMGFSRGGDVAMNAAFERFRASALGAGPDRFAEIDKSALGTRPTRSHLNVKQERQAGDAIAAFSAHAANRRARAAARTAWFASLRKPLDIDDVIAG